MARCNDCNKFCALETESEPEINLDVAEDGEVTGDVEIVNNCAECSTEITGYQFDVQVSPDDLEDEEGKSLAAWLAEKRAALAKPTAEDPGAANDPAEEVEFSFEVESEEGERTSRTEGKGRGTKTFYGASITFDVAVTWNEPGEDGAPATEERRVFSGSWQDDVQASSMDDRQ